MRVQELEPEMEELLHRLVPDLDHHLQGATEDQVAQLEKYAGQSLPRFYRWFQLRMGRSMGPLAYPTLDFSVDTILAHYTDGVAKRRDRFLIAIDEDNVNPHHLFYRLDHRVRDDAWVGKLGPDFETLREMFAWHQLLEFRIRSQRHHCGGLLIDEGGDALPHLRSLMESLGCSQPVPCGQSAGLFESQRACLIANNDPEDDPEMIGVYLGASDSRTLRDVLGAIRSETPLEIEIDEWYPEP